MTTLCGTCLYGFDRYVNNVVGWHDVPSGTSPAKAVLRVAIPLVLTEYLYAGVTIAPVIAAMVTLVGGFGGAIAISLQTSPVRADSDAGTAVGGDTARLRENIRRTVQRIRAGLDADAGDAAFRVAELRVERRRLHLELLNNIGRRHIAGDNFVGVRRRRAGRAVNRQIAAVAARAVNRVADDMRRLERAIQPLRTGMCDAGRRADKRLRIAVYERHFRHALLIHD